MQPIKITAKMLTNESLVAIVDAVIENRLLPDHVLLGWYKHGVLSQLKSVMRQLDTIKEKAKNKKITRKEYAALCRKEEQLVALGNKKLAILKEFDDATDSPAK